jgi:prolyl 4-hydroxylase
MNTKQGPKMSASQKLLDWIAQRLDAGDEPAAVLYMMCAEGWSDQVAAQALADELARRAPPGVPVPEPDVADRPRMLRLPDRDVEVLAILESPRVVVLGGFLADDECDELRSLAEGRLTRSAVVMDADSAHGVIEPIRTSEGTSLPRGHNALCQRIEKRIAAMLRWPVERGEGLELLRYVAGTEYMPHVDYFPPEVAVSSKERQRGGQRVATLLMYLQSPAKGGTTRFDDVGFEVAPVKGNAVFFSYASPDQSSRSRHAGMPVTEGEKWVATKWMRHGRFR